MALRAASSEDEDLIPKLTWKLCVCVGAGTQESESKRERNTLKVIYIMDILRHWCRSLLLYVRKLIHFFIVIPQLRLNLCKASTLIISSYQLMSVIVVTYWRHYNLLWAIFHLFGISQRADRCFFSILWTRNWRTKMSSNLPTFSMQ